MNPHLTITRHGRPVILDGAALLLKAGSGISCSAPGAWRRAVLNSNMASTTRHVLLTLACHLDEAGMFRCPTIEGLHIETGLTIRTVAKHLKIASAAGWISLIEHRSQVAHLGPNNDALFTEFRYLPTKPDMTA